MHQSVTTVFKWALFASLVLTTACASSSKLSTYPSSSTYPSETGEVSYVETSVPSVTDHSSHIDMTLRAEVADWRGTPFRYGGTDHNGLDCSAFVKTLFKDLFNVGMPRTTEQQVRLGIEVPPDALRAGDLVFFLPSNKTRHVGVYLSQGEFAHVSTSQGVTISHLSDQYWRDSYWTSRRILPDVPPSWASVEPSEPIIRSSAVVTRQREEQRPEARRIGW